MTRPDRTPPPVPNDDKALTAACVLLVQAHRVGAWQLEELAAVVIHDIEQRARAAQVQP